MEEEEKSRGAVLRDREDILSHIEEDNKNKQNFVYILNSIFKCRNKNLMYHLPQLNLMHNNFVEK